MVTKLETHRVQYISRKKQYNQRLLIKRKILIVLGDDFSVGIFLLGILGYSYRLV
jgi:hypothetical protein